MTAPVERGWKDHPVIIAIASGAAALVFAQTVIFPTMTASLQNELSSLRSEAQEISSLRDQLKKTQEDAKAAAKAARDELLASQNELLASQKTNVFSLGDPYPVGFGKVKLGDALNAIASSYPESSINRASSSYWSIKTNHPVFDDVVYYFDRPADLKDRRVRAMLIFAKTDMSEILQVKLIEALGQPISPGPEAACYIWTINKNLFVKKRDSRSFSIEPSLPDCKVQEK